MGGSGEERSHRVGRDRDHLVDVVGRVVRLDAVTGPDVDHQERHEHVVVEDEHVVQAPLGRTSSLLDGRQHAEAGVTHLSVNPVGKDPVKTIEQLRELIG